MSSKKLVTIYWSVCEVLLTFDSVSQEALDLETALIWRSRPSRSLRGVGGLLVPGQKRTGGDNVSVLAR